MLEDSFAEGGLLYTAAVLQYDSVARLKELVTSLKDLNGYAFATGIGDPLPHHMTIQMGGFDRSLNGDTEPGQSCLLVSDAFFMDQRVCAARVIQATCWGKPLRSTNAHPHITLCINPPGKPVDSNRIDWINGTKIYYPTMVQLKATLLECQ